MVVDVIQTPKCRHMLLLGTPSLMKGQIEPADMVYS